MATMKKGINTVEKGSPAYNLKSTGAGAGNPRFRQAQPAVVAGGQVTPNLPAGMANPGIRDESVNGQSISLRDFGGI